MTISTYTTLKTQVFNFSGRDDLSESFATFVQMAENYIYHNEDQPLRVQDLITTTTLTTVAGTNSLALPADFLSGLSVLINNGGIKRELVNTSPSALGRNGESGIPTKYSIAEEIVFDYIPDGAYEIELTYYAQPSALDTTNNTNIVLTKYPDIYLFACLSAVNDLSGEDQESERYYQKMMRSIRGAIRSNRQLRHSPGASARTRGPTP